ncbi:MAG: hypothetical protein ACI92E_002104, partial [Oceanicoccus sp.]
QVAVILLKFEQMKSVRQEVIHLKDKPGLFWIFVPSYKFLIKCDLLIS